MDMTKTTLLITSLALCTALPVWADSELFVDLGASLNKAKVDEWVGVPAFGDWEASPHLGLGVRRYVGDNKAHSFGVRVEYDRVVDEHLVAIRALDYRYAFGEHLAVNAFFGAARLDYRDIGAFGYYLGAGVSYLQFLHPNLSLHADLRYGDKLARDKNSPDDPPDVNMDTAIDVVGVSTYLSWRF